MISGIITLLFGICSFIMLTQPAFALYGGENSEFTSWIKEYFNKNLSSSSSGYDLLTFSEDQNVFWVIGNVFLIIAMVFCGLMLIFTILNLIMQASGKNKIIGTRVFAVLFSLFAFLAVIMYILLANEISETTMENIIDAIKNDGLIFTVGYGLIGYFVSSFISIFFASSNKKKRRKR